MTKILIHTFEVKLKLILLYLLLQLALFYFASNLKTVLSKTQTFQSMTKTISFSLYKI